ncbi:MAG: fluoride efflux transporter FluC [Gaiellales bacterium]
MSGWVLIAIPLGGLGAVLRVLLTRAGEERLPGGAPAATALVNVIGAGLLGLVAGWGGDVALLVLGGGLLGGMTTFSTWMVEADATATRGHARGAILLGAGPLVVGALAYAATRTLA